MEHKEVALTHARIVVYNAGPANITVEGFQIEPGEQEQWTVFKGVNIHGEVSTGERSFDVTVEDAVMLRPASSDAVKVVHLVPAID